MGTEEHMPFVARHPNEWCDRSEHASVGGFLRSAEWWKTLGWQLHWSNRSFTAGMDRHCIPTFLELTKFTLSKCPCAPIPKLLSLAACVLQHFRTRLFHLVWKRFSLARLEENSLGTNMSLKLAEYGLNNKQQFELYMFCPWAFC